MAQLAADIRGVMIPVTDARVLLPNASVSEVITYGDPQPIDNAPDWVFGVITWRGWRIPLFSFSLMSGQAQEENFSGAKVAIIKALAGEGEMPFMAMLAQGFPRLTAVTTENLLLDGDQGDLPPGVRFTVNVNDDPAFVPDLDGIEMRLMEVLGYREPELIPSVETVDPDAYPPEDVDDLDFDGMGPESIESLEVEPGNEEPDEALEHDDDEALAVLEVGDDEALAAAVSDSLSFDDEDEEDPLASLDVNDDGEPLETLEDSLAELGDLDDELRMLDESTNADDDGDDLDDGLRMLDESSDDDGDDLDGELRMLDESSDDDTLDDELKLLDEATDDGADAQDDELKLLATDDDRDALDDLSIDIDIDDDELDIDFDLGLDDDDDF